ncbi:hypothetical protein PTNB85_10287 [Pyrenophora teres f. teres]|uniref:Uncharacterized protein n=1 Tax=Pyrenophora teres f. teres TaxID=97479 RepID=A0A6S6WG12_9PLEO|nr:hypothetical protein PTNB85_10287 [Pyrenophora teres f. teres]KAE8823226.1 hypothetical protein HRS9139_09635 [Pyrenophora teres f. teres]KAE8854398.1 hypothetical protein PTNB29_09754 [Pyrenophora teres f. teres]CAE7220029.1 hypothetical protein PTTW11_11258 [Pyrenophora teres f. teres]
MAKVYKPAPYTPLTSECVHGVPSSLARKLAKWMKSCPTCVITRLAHQLEILQRMIARHGGIFKQKETHPMMHQLVRKEWVTAKLEMQNTIDRLEDLLKDEDMGVEDVAMLKEALQVWEKKRDGLEKVPGVRYADDAEEKEPTKEEKKGARLLMVWLKMVLQKEMSQEEQEEVATPTKSGLHRQRVPVRHQNFLLSTTPPVTSPQKGSCANSQQPSSTTTSTWNPTPATPFEPQQTKRTPPTTPKTPTTPPFVKTQQKVATPKSSIKRPRIDSPPGSPPIPSDHKRVRIADRVTISPKHLNVVNPSPFEPLPRTQITVPHAAHTVAEHRRRRREFHRGKHYVPGAWASRDSSIKANTSFFRVKNKMMEVLVRNDLVAAKGEMEIVKQLKLIASHWLVLWWAKHVVPKLDLEKLVEDMGQMEKKEEV